MAERTVEFLFKAQAETSQLGQFGKEIGALDKRLKSAAGSAEEWNKSLRGIGAAIQSDSATLQQSKTNLTAIAGSLRNLASAATVGSDAYFRLTDAANRFNVAAQPGTIGKLNLELQQNKQRLTELDLAAKGSSAEYARLQRSITATDAELKRISGSYTTVAAAAQNATRATAGFNAAQSSLARNPITGRVLPPVNTGIVAPFSELPPGYFDERRSANRRANQQAAGGRTGNRFMAAGAISAGAFFGGFEGAAGGLIGAALGGPGAALGGASIGAQVGIVRKQIGEFATLEAQLTKYNIALQNVAGSQAEFERAQAAIASANERLNIPLLQGTQTFTQLAAAVVGAGGNIADAELAFNAVNSAIKATGGSSRDVEGAMLAITQVFSKGKVSAEELRQQLGERLPGAFNLFATSIGKTGPELDKALRDGTVGLNDLMTFLVELQKRYQGTAEEIAASSEDAGARLTAAWEQARLAIGEALQPIGAEFQEGLIAFLVENEEGIKQFAEAMAGATKATFDFVVAVGPTAVEVGKLVVVLGLSKAALGAAAGAWTVLTAATTAGGVAITGTTGKVALATAGITKLKVATLALAAVWAKPLVLAVAVTGVATAISQLMRAKALRDELSGLNSDSPSEFVANRFGSTVPSVDNREQYIQAQSELAGQLGEAQARLRSAQSAAGAGSRSTAIGAGVGGLVLGPTGAAIGGNFGRRRQQNENLEVEAARAQIAQIEGRMREVGQLLGRVGTGAGSSTGPSVFPDAEGAAGAGGRSATDSAARDAERLAAEQRRLAEARAQQDRALAKQLFDYQLQLDQQRYDNLRRLMSLQRSNEVGALDETQREVAGLGVQLESNLLDVVGRLREANIQVRQAREQLESAQKFQGSITEFTVPARAGGGAGSASGRPVPPQVIEYLTGDPAMRGSRYYDPAGHGGAVHHEHLAFQTRAQRDLAIRGLQARGIAIGSTDRPGDPGYHGSQQAIDVPAYPNFQRLGLPDNAEGERRLGAMVRGALWEIFGGSGGGPAGSPAVRSEIGNLRSETDVATAQAGLNQALEMEKQLRQDISKEIDQYIRAFELAVEMPIRDQISSAGRELDALKLRNRLLLEGADPATIEFEERLLALRVRQDGALAGLNDRLGKANELLAAARKDGDQAGIEAAEKNAKTLQENIENLPGLYGQLATATRDLYNESQRMEQPWERLQQAIVNVRGELENLQDPVNQIQIFASGIGDAFGNSFGSVITGSSSVKEAMANLFRDVSNLFADMVSRIIAKAVEAQILQGAQGGGGGLFGWLGSALFGGLGGGVGGGASFGGGYFDPLTGLGAAGPNFGFAKGGGFAKNNIIPFASGGIVGGPTLFKFANGGTVRNGVMGEAGPEAIMPLRRTSSGDLGVVATGSGRGGVVNQVTVNVDAKGSNVSGDNNESRKLGAAISDAVQAELVKQQRPGGLLDRSRTKR